MRRNFRLAFLLIAAFCSSGANATISTYDNTFTWDWSAAPFGIPIGIGTTSWHTKVELIVPRTKLTVGEVGDFTILGNITNTTTGLADYTINAASIFGTPDKPIVDAKLKPAQPYKSFIEIGDPEVLSGPKWNVRAFDQVSTGTSTFNGTLSGVGASWSSSVQGTSVADWFEPIGETNQRVRVENRLLDSDHGLFTGSGASWEINGYFKSIAPGTTNLTYTSQVHNTVYGALAPIFFKYLNLGQNDIFLSVPITEVSEPSTLFLFTIGLLGLVAFSRKREKIKNTRKLPVHPNLNNVCITRP